MKKNEESKKLASWLVGWQYEVKWKKLRK